MDRGLDFPQSSQPLCTRTFLHTHACTPCAHCLPSTSVLCTHAVRPAFFFFHTWRADQSGRLAPFSSALNLLSCLCLYAPCPLHLSGSDVKIHKGFNSQTADEESERKERKEEERREEMRREERTSYFVCHNRDILTSLSIAPARQRLPQKILSGSLSPPPLMTFFFSSPPPPPLTLGSACSFGGNMA